MSPQQNSKMTPIVFRQNTMRRFTWSGGELALGVFRNDDFGPFDVIYPNAHCAVFMLSGHVRQRNRKIDGKRISRNCHAGEIEVFRAATPTNGESQGELKYIMMLIDSAYSAEFFPNIALQDPWVVGSARGATLPLLSDFCSHIEDNETPEPLFVDSAASLLAFKLSELSSGAAENPLGHALPPRLLRMVVDYVEANLARQMTLTELASLTHLSTSQFSVAFRNATGTPPYRFVVFRRIERAKTLLRNKALAISDVSLLSGFSNQSHFASAFKAITRMTPLQYRSEIL